MRIVVKFCRDRFDQPLCELVEVPCYGAQLTAMQMLNYAAALSELGAECVRYSGQFKKANRFVSKLVEREL